VPLARAAGRADQHPAGVSSVFGWRASNQSAVATLHRLASEPPSRHPGIVSGRYVMVLVQTLTAGAGVAEPTSANRPTHSLSAHSVAVSGSRANTGARAELLHHAELVDPALCGIAGCRRTGDPFSGYSTARDYALDLEGFARSRLERLRHTSWNRAVTSARTEKKITRKMIKLKIKTTTLVKIALRTWKRKARSSLMMTAMVALPLSAVLPSPRLTARSKHLRCA